MAVKMPRAMVDLDDFAESDNILIYADTGVGKTELVSQLPGRVLVISSENGTTVIKRSMARRGVAASDAKRFKVWPIRKFQDMEEAYAWVRDNPGNFDWVAIDSATSVQQRAMRAAMEVAVGRNPEKRDIDLPDRGEHQKMQNAMKRMVADFNELPVNTLWLAQAMRREDKDGNEIVVPFIMGKDYEVSAFVCAQMQAFGYMMKKASKQTKGQTDRVIIWDSYVDGGGVNYWSKDRYDVFPKICVMSKGDKQTMLLTDLLDMITGDSKGKAARAVETRDDDEQELLDTVTEPEDMEEENVPETDEEDEEQDERVTELMAMKPFALGKVMRSLGMDPKEYKGVALGEIVAAIVEAEAEEEAEAEAAVESAMEAEPDADEEEGTAEEDLSGIAAEEPEPEEDTEDDWVSLERERLLHATPVELKKAVESAGLTVAEFKGVPRDKIVDTLLPAQIAAEELGSGEDELDLEGMAEEEAEPEPEPPPAPVKRAAKKTAPAKKATTTRIRATS